MFIFKEIFYNRDPPKKTKIIEVCEVNFFSELKFFDHFLKFLDVCVFIVLKKWLKIRFRLKVCEIF